MTRQTQHSKKTATKKQAATKKTAAKRSAARYQEEPGAVAEERHSMITEAAYLIAEQRGFQGDMALDDWVQAEAEVDARLATRH